MITHRSVRYLHCKRQINHRVKALEEERTLFSTSSNGHTTHMCYTGGTGFHQIMTFGIPGFHLIYCWKKPLYSSLTDETYLLSTLFTSLVHISIFFSTDLRHWILCVYLTPVYPSGMVYMSVFVNPTHIRHGLHLSNRYPHLKHGFLCVHPTK